MADKTLIQPIKGSVLNGDLAEGIAVFVPQGLVGIRLESESFLSMYGMTDFEQPEMVVYTPAAAAPTGVVRLFVYVDNSEKIISSVEDMRRQVNDTLDAFAKGGVKSVAMNGIRCDDRPDPNVRPETYQKRFVEEYVAAHPDAFDTIYLVDLRGGFNRC